MANKTSKRQWAIALTLILSVILLDQATKWIISVKMPIREVSEQVEGVRYYHYEYIKTPKSIDPPGPIVVIPGFFYIVHVVNKGAAWGIFHGRMGLLTLISLVASVIMLIYFHRICEGYKERVIGMGLLIGGTIGNLIDRMNLIPRPSGIRGVVDFLSFHGEKWEYPAFNIADAGICIGVAILCLSTFVRPEKENDKPSLYHRLKARFGKSESKADG